MHGSKAFKLILLLILFQFKFITAFSQWQNNRFSVKAIPGDKNAVAALSPKRLNSINSDINSPPAISYQSPQTYVLNQPITALAPTNTGGSVPETIYGQVSTFAGSPYISYFLTVTGVTIDKEGNVYAADHGTNAIKKISPTGVISHLAGDFSSGSGFANGKGTSALFNLPDALVIDASGNLYASDLQNNAIRKITPDGTVTTFAGNGNIGFADGTGSASTFYDPRGMAIDDEGNIYVADQANNLIRKITATGVVTTYTGKTAGGFTNGSLSTATFNSPTAVGLDNKGNLYVADAGNNAIRKITPDGTVSTFATGFNFPREIRADGTGNLYVADQNSYTVKRIAPNGTVQTIAGSGMQGYTDGIGNAAAFSSIIGVVLDGKGNLFLGDSKFVRKITISGYTIDKPLPAGLTFDPKTGIISGTPQVLSPPTNYTITAYNGGGSSTTIVNIAVALTAPLKPSVITLPLQQPGMLNADNSYDPKATSTNPETPITYTSSNTDIATVTPDGMIHVIAPGVTIITAYQKGDDNYSDAIPVSQTLTVTEYLRVYLPDISIKTVCDGDFNADASIAEPKIPATYSSSNPSVATISSQGVIHIIGVGNTTITVSQNADPPLYVSAVPQSRILTVTLPVLPDISIAAIYAGPCLGNTVTFAATANHGGIKPTYQWQVNGINTGTNAAVFTSTTLADGDNVTCIYSNNDNTCVAAYPVTSNVINVNLITPSMPSVTISASVNYVFTGTPITFTANVNNAKQPIRYQWQVNGINAGTNSSTFDNDKLANGDQVTCIILSDAPCTTPATSEPIKVYIVSRLEIPNTFTPNADGINDTWTIRGIASYPNCLVSIYNRYGILLYQSKGYQQAWNGTVKESPVPVATYYYVIDLNFQGKILSGYVTVIR